MVKQWSPMSDAILQAWIGAQSICGQFCWFMLWLLGISEKNVLALEQMTHKPVCWLRYVDDIFIIWPHGKETLTEFLNHLTGLHNKIQFTMEEEESHLPLLHIDIYRKMDSSLGYRVFWKPTHTNLHLKKKKSWLLWHTEPKLSVPRIPSPENWNFDHRFHWYTLQEIWWSLKTASQTAKTNIKPTSTAFIPYTQTMYSRLNRMLAKHIIRSVRDCILPL